MAGKTNSVNFDKKHSAHEAKLNKYDFSARKRNKKKTKKSRTP